MTPNEVCASRQWIPGGTRYVDTAPSGGWEWEDEENGNDTDNTMDYDDIGDHNSEEEWIQTTTCPFDTSRTQGRPLSSQ